MNVPFRPPGTPEEVVRRGREFQRLSSNERWAALFDTIQKGFEELAKSPDREAIEKWMDEQEEEWQRIQKELFRRYGDTQGSADEPSLAANAN